MDENASSFKNEKKKKKRKKETRVKRTARIQFDVGDRNGEKTLATSLPHLVEIGKRFSDRYMEYIVLSSFSFSFSFFFFRPFIDVSERKKVTTERSDAPLGVNLHNEPLAFGTNVLSRW